MAEEGEALESEAIFKDDAVYAIVKAVDSMHLAHQLAALIGASHHEYRIIDPGRTVACPSWEHHRGGVHCSLLWWEIHQHFKYHDS